MYMTYCQLQEKNRLFIYLFFFDKNLYRQINGVAMGSPLGSILANDFLCDYEKEWLHSCPLEFNPKLYKKYVDEFL